MYIVDHSRDQITVYHEKDRHLSKTIYYESLEVFFKRFAKAIRPEEDYVFLLNEDVFNYFSYTISYTAEQPFTISDIKKIIATKQQDIVDNGYSIAYMSHHIANISCDGVSMRYLLGKQGNITFELHICTMRRSCVAQVELLGSILKMSRHIRFLPRHYATISYLESRQQDTYALLFVEQHASQLIVVRDGRYTRIETVNIGLRLLKDCYKSHDIEKYYYTQRQEIEEHPFRKELIDNAICFFTDSLAARLHSYVPTTYTIMVAGEVIENPSFLPLFQQSLASFGSAYVIPLPALNALRYKNYTFSPGEIAPASRLYMHR